MLIKNNNPKYGDAGPFEVGSIDELVSEMMPLFRQWAEEDEFATWEELAEEFKAGLGVMTA